ncbi:hypothetical protein [Paracoccus pacificus]|uniref:Uncharacterized protein n=1 Tax=Paracoccus pacificus TaxID=1463598 RepID=A0ABW4R4R3_9RHOB
MLAALWFWFGRLGCTSRITSRFFAIPEHGPEGEIEALRDLTALLGLADGRLRAGSELAKLIRANRPPGGRIYRIFSLYIIGDGVQSRDCTRETMRTLKVNCRSIRFREISPYAQANNTRFPETAAFHYSAAIAQRSFRFSF